MAEQIAFVFKVVMIGPEGVGKSSLMKRLAENQFSADYQPTIGVDLKIWICDSEGKAGKLQIWDLAGQERFKNLTKVYYRVANGVFIIYDVTNLASFEKVPEQLQEVKEMVDENQVIFLIGNKSDLEGQREISTEQGQALADSLGMTFIETSALDSSNVEKAFIEMGSELQRQKTRKQPQVESQRRFL